MDMGRPFVFWGTSSIIWIFGFLTLGFGRGGFNISGDDILLYLEIIFNRDILQVFEFAFLAGFHVLGPCPALVAPVE